MDTLMVRSQPPDLRLETRSRGQSQCRERGRRHVGFWGWTGNPLLDQSITGRDPQQRVGCEVAHTPFRKRPLSLLKGDIGGYMSDVDLWEGCPLCKYHQMV